MNYLSKPELARELADQHGIIISDMGIRRYIKRYQEFFSDKVVKHRIEYFNPSCVEKLKDIFQWINEWKFDPATIRIKLIEVYGEPEEQTKTLSTNISNSDLMKEIKSLQDQIKILTDQITHLLTEQTQRTDTTNNTDEIKSERDQTKPLQDQTTPPVNRTNSTNNTDDTDDMESERDQAVLSAYQNVLLTNDKARAQDLNDQGFQTITGKKFTAKSIYKAKMKALKALKNNKNK